MSEITAAKVSPEQGPQEPSPPPALLQDIDRLQQDNRRWRGRCLAACAAFVFLLTIAVIQFVGTFITLRLMYEARLESQRLHQRADEALKTILEARQQVQDDFRQVRLLDGQREEHQRQIEHTFKKEAALIQDLLVWEREIRQRTENRQRDGERRQREEPKTAPDDAPARPGQ